MKVVAIVVGLMLYAEFVGYFLHKLLHSENIAWLSKSHMTHHLKDYGPKSKMRTKEYVSGTAKRFNILGIGMEYLLPSALILIVLVGALTLLGMPWGYQALSVAGIIVWSGTMFGYMHSRFHEKDFWMANVPLLGTWYRKVRRLHDIHHVYLTEDGLMGSNYGICFFWMDRLFGTFRNKVSKLSPKGYGAAQERYKDILDK